ncbi:hypothetical protein F441_04386 [Phytophthora nicotianae CJ01A1]|uniref:SCP domain-containing protein n=4 Tax=Phytophthora nicotianae TaxID=4792 RepID=W2QHK3_PHYN3|nr:hypothetical protein PPTG_08738 [Phytophthora nicotianae INRA-310]ETK92304.1 hypothetical protein L915_04296 [Phytophthora nicotianae]ETO81196.1 hypothetical protein F444_04435 [Phytophthora nicotianae P1976]ETP22249.1 hypothetical protein F441_04386 [Phytophthora nicotianae CJ01A1]KUF79298.1 SCP extracellular protein [Phytophthora nicotianae]ETL45691.1 hypothetical protein L916_04257 [Phytophthora nicotianae]
MVGTIKSSITLLLGFVAVSNAASLRKEDLHFSDIASPQTDNSAALLTRVNAERAAKGLPPLCPNKKLQEAAERHILDQAKTDYFSAVGTDNSTPEARVTAAGYNWETVDENFDAGSATVDAVVSSWLNSDGCHDAILGQYTMVGTAYVYNENTFYKHYWVQVYATGSSEECDA